MIFLGVLILLAICCILSCVGLEFLSYSDSKIRASSAENLLRCLIGGTHGSSSRRFIRKVILGLVFGSSMNLFFLKEKNEKGYSHHMYYFYNNLIHIGLNLLIDYN